MEKIARVRSVNFTESEKEVLVLIINKYKDIVENKKTDNVSNSEKTTAWQNIAKEFNRMRKRAARERSEMYKTGGGKADTNISKGDELLLSLINKKTIYGYESPWDSDQLECTITNREDIQDHTYSESWGNDNKENEIVLENETMDAIEIEDDNENFNIEPLIAIADHKNQNTETLQRSWKKYKPADLKKSKSESLRAHHGKKAESGPTRRRPAPVRAFTSSALGEKYQVLAERKLEYLECLTKEHELRCEALKLDIEIKKKHLENLL
ncbi:myb/sant-like dna-binding domain [Holotrichia oblita]|uniref:Myb/sant-like dna-binding domain n=1 Tax=Holotrichia oblita TaxID=644536 RepID=A0ACB9TNX2_HOLOL|nr:myb/sant-like dna-binding domain [Holotrichia oblita]